MKKPTLTQIKKSVKADGGTYEKAKSYLNGQDAYWVNGNLMTKSDMIERFMMGTL